MTIGDRTAAYVQSKPIYGIALFILTYEYDDKANDNQYSNG
jgi:hypothetical protein